MIPFLEMDAATAGLLTDHNNVPDKYSSLANFREEKWIGKGQFSVVYRARCLADNSIVALKKVKVLSGANCWTMMC